MVFSVDDFQVDPSELEHMFAQLAVTAKPKNFINKGYAETTLELAVNGCCVDDEINHIASILFNEDATRFHTFTPREQQATALLLLTYWQQTGKVKYLDLLHYVLPYCLEYIDTICPITLINARTISNEAFNKALRETAKHFLSTQEHILGCKNFTKLLQFIDINQDVGFITDAMTTWQNSYRVKPHEMATTLAFYVEAFSKMKDTSQDKQAAACKYIRQLLDKVEDSEFCLLVMYELFCTNKIQCSVVQWAQTLEKGVLLKVFVSIVNSTDFPNRRRRDFIKSFLHLQAPSSNLEIAAKLIPSITLSQAGDLFKKLSWSIKQGYIHPPLKVFMRSIASSSDEKIAELVPLFVQLVPLTKKLEMEVRKNPDHPGTQFLLDIARSPQFTAKNSLYAVWLDTRSPVHCLTNAALILKPNEHKEIELVTDRLLEHMLTAPTCPHLEFFLWHARTMQLDPEVKNIVITHLLNKNTPEALLFVAKLSGGLPLSAVWHLLKRIERCNPLDEQATRIRKEAFVCLCNTRWYFDPRKQDLYQTWYKKREIIFYTLADDCVHDLLDKLQVVSHATGASKECDENFLNRLIVQTFASEKKRISEKPKKNKNSLCKAILRLDRQDYLRAKAGEEYRAITSQQASLAEAVEEIPRPDSPELTEEN